MSARHCPKCNRRKNWHTPTCGTCSTYVRPRIPPQNRFWPKVVKTPGCWNWTGAKDRGGYGLHWMGDGKSSRVHRLAYEWLVGPIAAGLTLDHLCRNRACVNPDHLEPCTAGENARRSPNAPYWVKARQTHCKRGHIFSPENTALHHGRRSCRACGAARAKEMRKGAA